MQDSPSPVVAIVNPHSASGKTARAWKQIHSKLLAVFPGLEARETKFPDHAIALTREAVRRGCRRVIAVGGDGTLNEVVNGILSESKSGVVTLGLVPQGTGSDFRRAVNLPLEEAEAIEVIRRGKTARLDAMRVVYQDMNGRTQIRFAINVTSFGMGGAVAARANRSSKRLGGTATFLLATVATALGFDGIHVSLQEDDGASHDRLITNVAVGNGQYHGAGMYVCPEAVLDDGLLELTVIEKFSVLEIALNLRLLFNGRIYSHRKIHHSRIRKLIARSRETAAIEIDGEPLGQLPLEIAIVPAALDFIVP